MSTCGAKTRSGDPCQNPPVNGSKRCRMHGGTSPKGKNSPNYRHGLYSQYVSETIQEILDGFHEADADFTDPTEEIKLLQAVIASAEMLKRNVQDEDSLAAITRAISSLILSKQRAQQLQIERKKLIPFTEVEQFLRHVEQTLVRYLPEDEREKAIEDIRNFRLEKI